MDFALHGGSGGAARAGATRRSPTSARRPPRLWAELARAGLLGVALPDEHGGAGLGFLELCVLLEQAGRAAAPVPLVPTLVRGARRRRVRRRPRSSELLPASRAASDPDGGARTSSAAIRRAPRRARRDGDGFRLDGVKIAVPAADRAARDRAGALAATATRCLLVDPRDAPACAASAGAHRPTSARPRS